MLFSGRLGTDVARPCLVWTTPHLAQAGNNEGYQGVSILTYLKLNPFEIGGARRHTSDTVMQPLPTTAEILMAKPR